MSFLDRIDPLRAFYFQAGEIFMLARPGLPDFDYIKAESSQQVFDLLAEKGSDIKLLMGGTDLFVQMRDRGEGPGTLLDVKALPGMQQIFFDKKNGLKIGAAVTLNHLSGDPEIQKYYPVLCQAADTVGNYQIRNRATLGGNLCNASPSADLSPAVLVYNGQVGLESPRGERVLDLKDFWVGPGKTALAPDEYLKFIQFPTPPAKTEGLYIKLGRSKMGDLAIVGVAVLGYPDPDLPAGIKFRIGINSTAPTVYRLPELEEKISREIITEKILKHAADEAMRLSAPITDLRATAEYQKMMVRNLTFRGLKEVWERLK
jgi:CO/xanthine dehydrogenase FAD-binding subunit